MQQFFFLPVVRSIYYTEESHDLRFKNQFHTAPCVVHFKWKWIKEVKGILRNLNNFPKNSILNEKKKKKGICIHHV